MLPGKDSRLMAVPYTEGGKARQFDIRADRLWAGGLATAVVAALIRCTQNVHFSITPRARTVTSGLNRSLRTLLRASLNSLW